MIPSIVVGKLASRAFDSAIGTTTPEPAPSSHGPLLRAQERLARAEASLDVVDAYEQYAVPLALLAGAAVVIMGRR
jgi:hypothetical protein